MIYWQLCNSQQCWEQLEQSFGGENQHPELHTGAGRKPAKGEMLQKNSGDATGAVPSCNTEKPGSALPAPCQPAYSAGALSQRQRRWGWVWRAVMDTGAPTCSFSRVVTNVLPHPATYRGNLETWPASSSLAAAYRHAWLVRFQRCPFLPG